MDALRLAVEVRAVAQSLLEVLGLAPAHEVPIRLTWLGLGLGLGLGFGLGFGFGLGLGRG